MLYRTYQSSHLDSGDWVTVVNAKEVRVTGKKEKQKVYYRHSGYPGGLKALRLEEIREKNPARIVEFAVKNMLPKNRLRKRRMARLKVFAGEEHSYRNKFEARSTKSETNFKA
ncbi:MAG: 50S ribosomal protein L13 [Candidatus Blackburnbacteria bacterium]|nr:50S ribosomal protein L13 [Candidatus Blackburnbacteria bacterium]